MNLAIGRILKQRGLTQARFADDLGVSRGYMSELVSGKKSPSPSMIERICNMLDIGPAELFEKPPETATSIQTADIYTGFSENDAIPFTGPDVTGRRVFELMQTKARNPVLYTVNKSANGFGLLSGDALVVDLNYNLTDGNLVLATAISSEGIARTRIYRFASPWLLPHDASRPPVKLDETGNIAIVGTVTGSVRGLKL